MRSKTCPADWFTLANLKTDLTFDLLTEPPFIVREKQFNLPFVPLTHVLTGAETDIPELKERYWTVFQQKLFHERIAETAAKKRAGV